MNCRSLPVTRRSARLAVVACVGLATFGGLFVAGGGSASAHTTTATTTPSSTATGTAAAAPKPITINVASSKLGSILVDGDGMSLYMFVPDARNVSVCEGGCLTAWPPVMLRAKETLQDVVVAKGLRRSLLGVAMRADGSRHVTYNGFPLYYWFLDKAAGDTKGQWVNNIWFVLNPEGSPITPHNP